MPSPILPRSALAGAAKGSPRGAMLAHGTGLTIREIVGTRVLHLEAPRRPAALAPLLRVIGSLELPAIGRCASGSGAQLLGIGPGTWLLVSDEGIAAAENAAAAAFDVALALGDGWARLTITGEDASALLAKGCAIDLHPRQFTPGRCAVTGFARMRAVIWQAAADAGYDLLVARSFAVALWHWLEEAAAEFTAIERGRQE